MKYFIINWWLESELIEQELTESYSRMSVVDYADKKMIDDPDNYGGYDHEIIEVECKQVV